MSSCCRAHAQQTHSNNKPRENNTVRLLCRSALKTCILTALLRISIHSPAEQLKRFLHLTEGVNSATKTKTKLQE